MHILTTVSLYIALILTGCTIPGHSKAHDRDREPTSVNTSIYQQYYSKGALAMAMAASGSKAYGGTLNYQFVASGGYMDGESAAIVGIAKKLCGDCPLLQFNAGMTDNKVGYSFSGYWVIK